MKLQKALEIRGYCFADSAEDFENSAVTLVLTEKIELRDEDGDYVTQEAGQHAMFTMSIRQAEFAIMQLQKGIEEAHKKQAELLANA
jgi:hypothetical protein